MLSGCADRLAVGAGAAGGATGGATFAIFLLLHAVRKRAAASANMQREKLRLRVAIRFLPGEAVQPLCSSLRALAFERSSFGSTYSGLYIVTRYTSTPSGKNGSPTPKRAGPFAKPNPL